MTSVDRTGELLRWTERGSDVIRRNDARCASCLHYSAFVGSGG